MKIFHFALVMMIVGAIDGISNLPSIAIFGQQLIFFFITASLFFLIPVGLISAELCAQFKTESGIYVWVKKAFGSNMGAVAIWLQWINTMVWFPTCLTTLIGTIAWCIDPALIHNKLFLVLGSLSLFWAMTLANLKGVKQSTKISAWAASIGTLIPIATIIGLSITWMLLKKPLAITLTHAAIFPPLSSMGTWSSLTAIITTFLGMELATVHAGKIPNAHISFPKALFTAIIVIIFTMGLGSLCVALVIPNGDLSLVAGTMQAFGELFKAFHLPWLATLLGIMIVIGGPGTMVSWLISPANGLAHASKDGYLPKKLASENAHGVPTKIFLLQGFVVTLVASTFFLMPSINGSYWLLLDLSTEIYVIMYLLMFVASIVLIMKAEKIIIIPGGKTGALILAIAGLCGSLTAFVVGFFPPSNINVGSDAHYVITFAIGMLVLISPCILLLWHKIKTMA